MGSRVNHVISLLLLLFIFNLGISAEVNREASQRVITSPRKNAGGGVIDGSGLEHNNGTSANNNNNNNNNIRVSVSTVALFTLAMAAATGLGAVPFFFLELDPQWAGICNGMAAGVMLAASFDLIQEGQEHGSGGWVVLGILAGGIFILLCKKILEQYGEISMLDIKGADARKAILVVGIMTLHSFGEGSGVGVSFAGSKGLSQGLLVTLAIAVHNIPEGLAVSMVLASRGVAPQKAMLWSVITSLPQPIVAVPSFICADAFNKFLPFATGFAAGCMIWMVMAEVLPDAFKESSASNVASAATLSVAFMEALGALFEHFSHTYNPEDASGIFVSLLFFGLGPLLGGIALVSLALSFRLQHALLTGISSGIAFVLATWRPLQLLLLVSSKMNLLPLLFLLALGSASLHIPTSILAKKNGKNQKKTLELSSSATGPTVSALALQSVVPCFALALHALAEGLALGAGAGRLGRNLVLPAFLHGFPRGAAAAGCVFGATGSWRGALFSAGLVGLVGPVSAIGSMLAGLDDYNGLDRVMVFACGGLVPGFVGMVRRGVKVDRRKTRVGLVVGVVFAGVWLTCTSLVCLHTPYCEGVL